MAISVRSFAATSPARGAPAGRRRRSAAAAQAATPPATKSQRRRGPRSSSRTRARTRAAKSGGGSCASHDSSGTVSPSGALSVSSFPSLTSSSTGRQGGAHLLSGAKSFVFAVFSGTSSARAMSAIESPCSSASTSAAR